MYNNNENGCGTFFILSFSFFFICKSNCKLSHNDSSVYVETNGSNIKINEDITMSPNYDTEYGVQAHSLTTKKKWLICETGWLDRWMDQKTKKSRNSEWGEIKMMIAVAEWWWLPQTASVYIINCSFVWLHLCVQSSANRYCKINLYNGKKTATAVAVAVAVAAVENVAIEQINES